MPGWTRRPPGRVRGAVSLAGAAALVTFAYELRGAGVAAAALATGALVLLAILRHEQVVRWSDAHGAVSNLAIVPPAFVGIACARRTMPLEIAALLALALGLGLAVLWLLLAARPTAVIATEVIASPAATPDCSSTGPTVAPPRLWAREADEPLAVGADA